MRSLVPNPNNPGDWDLGATGAEYRIRDYYAKGIFVFESGTFGPPTFTARSVGTRSVLAAMLDASDVDYAHGVESGAMWHSVPQATSGFLFKWYAGTTQVGSLDGTGNLTVTGKVKPGKCPVALAGQSAATSVTTATWTKAQLGTAFIDPDGVVDTANSRITPNMACIAMVGGAVMLDCTGTVPPAATMIVAIYKNGALIAQQYMGIQAVANQYSGPITPVPVQFNGTTDYVELWVYQNTGISRNTTTGVANTFLSVSPIRPT